MKKKKGFTLIELMVTLSIMALVTTMVGSVFIQGYKILNRTDKKSAIQDEVRNAIMNIEAESLKASEIKIRTADSITAYNSKSAKELLYLEKIDEKIVYLEVVEDSTNNINKFLEVKLNNDNTFKEEKMLINTIKGNETNNFALNSNIEDKVVNINFNNIVKGNQSSGESYIVTLNLNIENDIEIDFGDGSSEVIPEVPGGGTEKPDEEKDFLDKLGEHYLTISGAMGFQSGSKQVQVIGNGTIGYGSTSEGKEHFDQGGDKVIQSDIDILSLNNLKKEGLVITQSWNVSSHETYQQYNGFNIIFVNGDVQIGDSNGNGNGNGNKDDITLEKTIIIATGNVSFSKNNIKLSMINSLIYANAITFHNSSVVSFTNELTSQEIVDRTKVKLQEMIEFYSQPLSVEFSIITYGYSEYEYKILITNNLGIKVSSWEIEFDSDGEFKSCWQGKLEKNEKNRYIIKNEHWNGNIESGSTIEIRGHCEVGVNKIKNIKSTCL